jgi:prenyltransferase beta subunit
MGPFLGYLTVFFILLSMTRKVVQLSLARILKRNKANDKKTSFDLKLLVWLQKNHNYFGMLALLSALAHAAVQFSITGQPSLTGATLILLLVLQGVSGYMQEKKIGNIKFTSTVHAVLPLVMVVLIIAHIVLNSQGL